MTARLEFIAQSGEELVQMSLDTFSKSCLVPVQSHDLILNCLRTKVGSSNIVEDHQEKNLVSFHYLKGILNRENVRTLSIAWMRPRTKIDLHTSNLEQ
jgi:hypothetical protein